MKRVIGFEADTAAVLADLVNIWLAGHWKAGLVDVQMASAVYSDAEAPRFQRYVWSALVTVSAPDAEALK